MTPDIERGELSRGRAATAVAFAPGIIALVAEPAEEDTRDAEPIPDTTIDPVRDTRTDGPVDMLHFHLHLQPRAFSEQRQQTNKQHKQRNKTKKQTNKRTKKQRNKQTGRHLYPRLLAGPFPFPSSLKSSRKERSGVEAL